jgi:hypothetical protein
MKRISILFLASLLAACSTTQSIAPSPTPLPTSTPAPTSTSTPTPSPTPTPGPLYPASLSPADVDFLKAHADDPNVTWTVDADGVTTVEMHQPLNMTEAEEKAAINAECLGNCFLNMTDGMFNFFGVYAGETQTFIQPNGSTEVIAKMDILVKDQIRTVTMRWILDVKNSANEWLYDQLGIKGNRPTLDEISRIFAVGKSASPVFIRDELPSPYKDTAYYKQYIESRYGSDYFASVQAWIGSGFNPDLAVELVAVSD